MASVFSVLLLQKKVLQKSKEKAETPVVIKAGAKRGNYYLLQPVELILILTVGPPLKSNDRKI